MVPLGTWLPKAIAAGIAGLAAAYHSLNIRRNDATPVLSAWLIVFFIGGATSAALGTILEAAFNDLEHGAGWNSMLVALHVAALGASASGCYLLSHGTAWERITTRVGIYLTNIAFAVCLFLIFSAPEDGRFDLAFTLASYSGVVLIAGALALACRERAARAPCGLILFGVCVTGAGYGLDAMWLAPACDPPPPHTDSSQHVALSGGACPLPAGWTADGFYHASLALSYLCIFLGSVPLTRDRRRAAGMAAAAAAAVTPGSSSGGGSGAAPVFDAPLLDASSGSSAHPPLPPAAAACIAWAEWGLGLVHALVLWVMTAVPPSKGAQRMKVKHAINLHKLCCGPAVALLMLAHRCRTLHAYAYLAMHGSYGLTWLIKDQTFPDRSWEAPASVSSFLALLTLLCLFWIAPALVVSAPASPPPEVTFFALVLYIFGFFFLHVGDAQKFYSLRLKPGHLIDDSMFGRTRNPNYFGELLIYSAFALSACASEWWYLPWCVNLFVWSVLFVPNWINKDRSISRHVGWASYRRRSGLVVPWIFGDGWWGDGEERAQ